MSVENLSQYGKMARVIASEIATAVIKVSNEVDQSNLSLDQGNIPPNFQLSHAAHRKLLNGDALDKSLNKLSNYRSRSPENKIVVKGALIGSLVGGGITSLITSSLLCKEDCCPIALAADIIGTGIGAGLGAGVGGIINVAKK